MGRTSKRLRLSRFTGRYVGAPYCLGGRKPAQGLDCLSLILAAAKAWKVPAPDEFEGVTRESYAELWNTNRKQAKAKMIRFVRSLGDEIPVSRAFAGDVLIIKPLKGDLVVGIHAGNDLVLSAFTDVGVKLANLQDVEVKRAIRWRKN